MDIKNYKLVIPDETYEKQYTAMMDKWESIEDNIQPQLLRRYSKSLGENVSYSKWLEWCEDDRTTGSMLSTGVPCTLYFLVDDSKEIYGAIVVNSANTHRGHLHAGIAPWHRGRGLGTIMLRLALDICRDTEFKSVEIVPYENNHGAIKTILKNGGKLKEKFCDDGKTSLRFEIDLQNQYAVRPFTEKDVNFIYNLMSEENNLSALHTEIISLEEWQKAFAEPQDSDEENFIVCKNDIPCAWLKLNGLQNKEVAWISMLVVSDEFKSQGVGKFAVEFAIQYLKQRGYKQVKLHTTKDNLIAIGLYNKCGFRIVDRSKAEITMCKEV